MEIFNKTKIKIINQTTKITTNTNLNKNPSTKKSKNLLNRLSNKYPVIATTKNPNFPWNPFPIPYYKTKCSQKSTSNKKP